MALTVNNIGNNNAATRGLPIEMENAIQLYSGTVLTAFTRKTLFSDLVWNKSIPNGSSTTFPVIGQGSDDDTHTHIPGQTLTMSTVPVKERLVNIDALEYFALAVDKFEEAVLHFETRTELARQAGEALAVKIDKAVAKTILLASQTSGSIGGTVVQPDGSEVNNDAIDTGTPSARGNALIESIFAAVALMEEKDVTGEKVFVCSPLEYSYLAQSDAINKDLTSSDNGGLDKGVVMSVAGIKIMKSNYLPKDGVDVGGVSKKLKGLLFNNQAVALVKLVDVTSETNYIPEQLATLLTSYYSYGMGVLKPAASCAITGGNA